MTEPIHPLISIVVLAYSQFERTTLPCLLSLAPWFNDSELEFIVYDNASPDGSGDRARDWCQQQPGIQFIQSPTNRGYAGGMNDATAGAQGQWLLLVNNDTEFPAHAIDALKTVIKAAPPQLAMIGPVTNSAGNGQRLCAAGKTRQECLNLGAWLNTHPTGLLLPTYRSDFFCIAIRRDAWLALNGLDTQFGMGYFEDFDFSLRLRASGYEQSITEDVFIFHQGSVAFKKTDQIKQLMRNNKKLMKVKHHDVEFKHVRLDNLDLIRHHLNFLSTLDAVRKQSEHLQLRLSLRKDAMRIDAPKSFFKRLLWQRTAEKFLK